MKYRNWFAVKCMYHVPHHLKGEMLNCWCCSWSTDSECGTDRNCTWQGHQ